MRTRGLDGGGGVLNLDAAELSLDANAAYLHLGTNETIHGIEIDCSRLPQTAAPIVADMSSPPSCRDRSMFRQIRDDLCRRAEEHRASQRHPGDRPRRSARSCAATILTVLDYAVMAEMVQC